MPRSDRTGPVGVGPRTGRGMGHCADDAQADRESQRGVGMGHCADDAQADWESPRGAGMGWRLGPGYGRGRRSMRRPMRGRRLACRGGFGVRGWDEFSRPCPTAPADTGDELEQLGAQAGRLQRGLDALRARMDELREGGQEG